MFKLQDIRNLVQEHAVLVSSSPGDWMDYMDTASRLYRYSFSDQLLIHAQRPDATDCASLELWNEKMLRWVNRGARGIALFDETWQNTKLHYVFDISDTHMVAGGRSPYLWKMQEHQREEILTHLAEVYAVPVDYEDLMAEVEEAGERQMQLAQLLKNCPPSIFEDYDRERAVDTCEGIAMQFTKSKGYLTVQATEEGYFYIFMILTCTKSIPMIMTIQKYLFRKLLMKS